MRFDTSVFDGPGRPLLHEFDQGGVGRRVAGTSV